MSLKHGILGFLKYSEMTGYELSKAFDSSMANFWHASSSQIYRELDSLQTSGLVSCEMIVQRDKPNKKVYNITETGEEAFGAWLSSQSDDFVSIRNSFLVGVFFAGERSPDELLVKLERLKSDCENILDESADWSRSAAAYGDAVPRERQIGWLLTADFGKRYYQMCVDWADNAASILRGEPNE
ncbi:MAG: PadR family transcriptional regulator [Oscillospiraceae bacterium]|jgi:DNA-binding PadR family transcriptional regulator|nr:PadR family transcriptional regulator [Oscillospiraceae bacterium]